MTDTLKPYNLITDFVTGKSVPDIGAEENRQAVERWLVEEKGYAKKDIAVDVPILLNVAGKPYRSRLDLVVSVSGTPYMVVKCAAGSLGSRERETVAAARLMNENAMVPLAVVSDGKTAIVLDTATGKNTGEGRDAVPTRAVAESVLKDLQPQTLSLERRQKEKLIFRSYDMQNVNIVHGAV